MDEAGKRVLTNRYQCIGACVITIVLAVGSTSSAMAAAEWRQGGLPIPSGLKVSAGFLNEPNVIPQIKDGKYRIECNREDISGRLAAPNKLESAGITLRNCEAENTEAATDCTVETPGAGANVLTTNTLNGELREVEAAEAPTERGLLYIPISESFLKFNIVCVPEAEVSRNVTGEVVAEVRRLREERSEINLIWAVSAGKQKIQYLKEALPPAKRTLLDGLTEVTLKTEDEFALLVKKINCRGLLEPADVEVT